jgi:hypothetical protein
MRENGFANESSAAIGRAVDSPLTIEEIVVCCKFRRPGCTSERGDATSIASPAIASESIGHFAGWMCSSGWSGNEPEDARMLDSATTILADVGEGGRASGKEAMARPRYQ